MKHIRTSALSALFLCLVLCRAALAAPSTPPRILVDSIHAHNALRPPAEAEQYFYHSNYGHRRAFNYLRARNVQVDEISSGRLTAEKLADYRMLFINLVSADLPPFTVPEIAAIKNYIEDGGSLLLITDHSNCYFHAYKLQPLLMELGIDVTTETACDRAPATLGTGNGWVAVTRFAEHAITKGLKAIALQTGGTVDDRYAVGMTSPQSWGDEWQHHPYGEGDENEPGAAPGFFGNWRQDAGERNGPLAVVAAKELGKGRIAIVADQNIFGDPFINYADNYRLWQNSVAWLTGETALAEPQNYLAAHSPRVLGYEEYSRAAFGDSSNKGYYNLFAALGRRLNLFANHDLSNEADAILFAHDNYQLPLEALDGVLRHLRAQRNIIVLNAGANNDGGVLRQIETKLGAPEVNRTGEGEQAAFSYQWPDSGYVLGLPRNQAFSNSAFPSPERKPNAAQQRVLETLLQLLNAALEPQE